MKSVGIAVVIVIFAVSMAVMGTYADFSDTESIGDNTIQTGSLDLRLANADGFSGANPDGVSQTWYYANQYPAGMAPGDWLEGAVYLQDTGSGIADHLDVYCNIKNDEESGGNDTDAENLRENEILITNGGGVDNDHDGLVDEDSVDDVDNDGDGLIDEDPPPGSPPIPVTPNRGIYDKDKMMIINYLKYQNTATIDIVWGDGKFWDPQYMADWDGDGTITLHDFEHHPVTNLPPPVSSLSNLSMKVTFGQANLNLNEYQGDRTNMTLVFALFS